MAEENFTIEDSDFDDAILDIADEIEKLKAIKAIPPLLKSDPQITLKVEMELKKGESSSTNFFKVLKTIQETQVHSGTIPSAVRGMLVTTERKYIHHSKGSDKKYHPLTITETITETVVAAEEISESKGLTLEDLFEDPEPEEKPSVVISPKKNPIETSSIIPVSNSQPRLKSDEKISDASTIKTVNIPNTITQNISRKLKENEKDIFRNLLKMQRR